MEKSTDARADNQPGAEQRNGSISEQSSVPRDFIRLATRALEKGNERRADNQPGAVTAFVFAKTRAVPDAWLRENREHASAVRRIHTFQPNPAAWRVVSVMKRSDGKNMLEWLENGEVIVFFRNGGETENLLKLRSVPNLEMAVAG